MSRPGTDITASAAPANARAQVDASALDRLFKPFDRSDAPGLAVGVALAGRPLYRRGFGLASVELPVALSPTIRMRIGSTSKHFTCLAVMLLAEQGRLSPDDPVRHHIPELPAWADAITLRQLMNHTSGMRCSLDLLSQFGGHGRNVGPGVQFRLLAKQPGVNFAPGASWSYNNGGYVLLTEIVERLHCKPFGAVLREQIFEAVGMNDTEQRPYDTDLVANSATLHVPDGEGGFTRGVFGPPIGGEGGIVSTVDDMLRWLAHMAAPRVGTRATWEAMRTPATTHGYGLGLFMQSYRGTRVVHHAGGIIGGQSQMLKVVDHDLDIIVIANRPGLDPSGLAHRVIDACVPGLVAPAKDVPAAFVTGTFHSAASGMTVRLLERDREQIVNLHGAEMPARPVAGGAFALDAPTTDLKLGPVLDGEQTAALDLTEFGTTERASRVDPPEGAKAPVGGYVCDEADAVGEISLDGDAARLVVRGPFGSVDYWLEPLGPELWLVTTRDPLLPLGGILETDAGILRFSTARTRRLPLRPSARQREP